MEPVHSCVNEAKSLSGRSGLGFAPFKLGLTVQVLNPSQRFHIADLPQIPLRG